MSGITEKDVMQIYSEEPLMHICDENSMLQIQRKLFVQMQDSIEDEIVKQVVKTAQEIGITDVVVLNKNAILKAVYKEVPRKPIANKVDVDKLKVANGIFRKNAKIYHCSTCDSFVKRADDYCSCCGQKLDWEVENENY